METTNMHEYERSARVRTARHKKRKQKEDFDKNLLRLYREQRALRKEIYNLGWTPLVPPVQRGYVRFFKLRNDVAGSKQASFFENLLKKINTTQHSSRKDFKVKRRKSGKKIYVDSKQTLRDVYERSFAGKEFTDLEKLYFEETIVHSGNKPHKVYRFIESWRFVLYAQPNIITKVRIKDFDLERRRNEIEKYLDVDSRGYRLRRLVDRCWKWNSTLHKYKNPLQNRPFSDILDEYLPEPALKISHKKPSESRGFFFFHPIFDQSVFQAIYKKNHISAEAKSNCPLIFKHQTLTLTPHNINTLTH